MQLEELQQQWQRLDEKLERTVKMNGELLRLAVMQPARRRLNRLAFWPALDTAFCVGVLLFAGSFLGKHWNTWSLVGPASVMMIAAIDWGGTVADIQSSLSRLRMAKIRQFKWIILLSPLVGFCGLILGLQWLLDRLPEPHFILDKLNLWWAAGNYAFGVLFILFGQAVVGFLAKRFRGRVWWQRALSDITGSSMKKTKEELERWASLGDKLSNDTD
jgi:hypothetical protein